MKNIFLLVDILQGSTGGAEKQILELSKNIDRSKYSLIVGCLSGKDALLNELSKSGVLTISFKIKRIYDIFGIIQGLKFKKFLRDKKVNILMTYHFGSDIWGTIFGRLARVPVIISNRRDMGFWKKWYHNMAYKLINRFINKVIVVSDAVKQAVIRLERLSLDKVVVVRNGIDLSHFKTSVDKYAIKNSLGISENTFVIGCVGNIKNVKGQEYLIKALTEVRTKISNFKCIFIGGEFEKEAQTIKNYIHICGVNDLCLFLGKRNDIPNLLSIMDICVLPSLSEGFSNTLLEYMAAGKPVVATSVGGNVELISHQENGILVPPADSYALAEATINLLSDVELRQRLCQAARKKVFESFSIGKMAKKYENLFEELTSKNKLKICHLISSNGLFGAEKVMLSLASNMNNDGVKSWVVALNNSHNPHLEIVKEAERNNIPVFIVESKGRFDLKSVSRLHDFIKENNIDMLHTHNYKANLIGLLAAKRTRIPVIATLHGYIGRGLKLKFYEGLDRYILRYFNKVILVDDSLKRWFKNGAVKYEVVNNGVKSTESLLQHDVSSFALQDKQLPEIVIGTVGRLSEEKGHRYLLEAFAKINQDYPNSQLLIVGDGDLRRDLEDLSVSLGTKEKTTFTGFQEKVEEFYSLIDIYVSPSLVEHFPLSILEAMGFGKAVVATNVGGTTNLIKDETTGILVNPSSTESIYQALLRYLREPGLIKTLGDNAYQFVQDNYSVERMLSEYKKVYEDTLCNA